MLSGVLLQPVSVAKAGDVTVICVVERRLACSWGPLPNVTSCSPVLLKGVLSAASVIVSPPPPATDQAGLERFDRQAAAGPVSQVGGPPAAHGRVECLGKQHGGRALDTEWPGGGEAF
jgi:hypothetical protein